MGLDSLDLPVHEHDLAALCADEAGNRVEDGGFTRAVGADERDDLPFGDLEADVLERVDGVVEDVDVLYFQHVALASFWDFPPPVPR